jgi:hypothetical protein
MAWVESLYENVDWRGGESETATMKFLVGDVASEAEARAAVLEVAPKQYEGLFRQKPSASPAGRDSYDVEVTYTAKKPDSETGENPDDNDQPIDVEFDMSVGTQHVTQAIAQLAKYAKGGETAPENYGAIGVTESGVAGVDVPSPQMRIRIRKEVYLAQLNWNYIALLYAMGGCTNSAPWHVFAIGEARFLGARIATKTSTKATLEFSFEISPNATNLVVGEITGIAKPGWAYMDVMYREKLVSTTPMMIVQEPVAVYIDQVSREANFNELGV